MGVKQAIRSAISFIRSRTSAGIANFFPPRFCRPVKPSETGEFATVETRKVGRLFRTVNMRINVGKWSGTGGLNVTKVRLAYCYHGFDA